MTRDGEVIGISDRLIVRESSRLSDDAAAAIKGVFTKGGQVRVEMHDKQSALLALAKHLRLFDDPPSQPSLTVNQVNVGALDAMETARRLAFVIEAARQSALAKPPITINGQVSQVVDAEPTD